MNSDNPTAIIIGREAIFNLDCKFLLGSKFNCLTHTKSTSAENEVKNSARPLLLVLNSVLEGYENLIKSYKDIPGVAVLVEKNIKGFLGETNTFKKYDLSNYNDKLNNEKFVSLALETFEAAKTDLNKKANTNLDEYISIKPGSSKENQV